MHTEMKMKLFSKDIFACIGNVQTEKIAGYLQIDIRKFGCHADHYFLVQDGNLQDPS